MTPTCEGEIAMKYFTGIDVSLRFVSICVVDEAGAVQYEGKVPAEVDLIVASLRRVSPGIRQVGLEAGTLTQYLTTAPTSALRACRRPHELTSLPAPQPHFCVDCVDDGPG
jgi:hypothetical protein